MDGVFRSYSQFVVGDIKDNLAQLAPCPHTHGCREGIKEILYLSPTEILLCKCLYVMPELQE